jgi:hypothetical protein
MDLKLTRKQFISDGVFSELSDADGNLIAHTLEHAYLQDDGSYLPKIPNGTYTCVRGMHQLDGMTQPFSTFEITGVQGHTNLLFHVGNYNSDSEGCVLLGLAVSWSGSHQIIINSKVTFTKFMQLQSGLDKFVLNVII